jgi:tetrahydromethanopterin S-methyltransferase subunit B
MQKHSDPSSSSSFSFAGCCGSIKGFRFLHVFYAVVIGVIIIAEIAIVIVFITYQNRFRSELVTKLQDSIAAYYVGTPTSNSSAVNPVSLSWDFAQFNLQCCGAVNKNDFGRATNWTRRNPYEGNATNLQVPFTCCPLSAAKSWTQLPTDMSGANNCAKTTSTAYERGCYDRLIDIVATYKNNVIIGLIIVGVVEVLALIFAVVLFRRKEDYNSL